MTIEENLRKLIREKHLALTVRIKEKAPRVNTVLSLMCVSFCF